MVGGAATVPDRRNQLLARLRQGPGEEAQQEMAVTPTTPAPSRWTLRTLRATFAWLHHYALSGVWRFLRRYPVKLRIARVQEYIPYPGYAAKVERMEQGLGRGALTPDRRVVVFMGQIDYTPWP